MILHNKIYVQYQHSVQMQSGVWPLCTVVEGNSVKVRLMLVDGHVMC